MKIKYNSLTEWKRSEPSAYLAAHRKLMISQICEIFGWTKPKKNFYPKGYWTLELCLQDALKYNSKSEWENSSSKAYSYALKRGKEFYAICCQHMKELRKPHGYWTLEICIKEALKYKTISGWHKNNKNSYQAARKNGWLEKCCEHMIELRKPNNYWTLDNCKKDALQYASHSEWSKNNSSAYSLAHKNGWLEKCCKHMMELKKPSGYWTLELCLQDALKYIGRNEWKMNSSKSYGAARRNGWIEKCCKHMVELKKSIDYWTFDLCLQDALKYNSKSEWKKANSSSVNVARKNGWLETCCKHMLELKKPSGYWTIDLCLQDALKYNSKSEWSKNSNAYYIAHTNGWIEKCCKHMVELKKPKNYWTLELCLQDALKYTGRNEWKINSNKSYSVAVRNKWLNECTKHMKS